MSLVLVSPTGDRRFMLEGPGPITVGRDVACGVPILDPGVSRRHAELTVDPQGVRVVDLDSRNGTWVNGQRVASARASVNDTIAFGSVKFLLARETDAPRPTPTAMFGLDGSATIMRERAMPSADQAVADVAERRLAQLVKVAQRLGGLGNEDELLRGVVDELFAAFEADRIAILRVAPANAADATASDPSSSDGASYEYPLETRIARDRSGAAIPRPVPRAIASGVAERQIALLTHDAREDVRTAGASVLQQMVRSAMAAPLLGEGRRTLGVLYVDNLRDASAFSDEDLGFLVAFAGIAAAAVEREASRERLREAARVRENFERYFTPQLAERIASATGDVVPGGERRHVLVLFSDIRGFTSIAESLPPVSMAAQLNEYFGAMVDCVFHYEGALDKFIGDALMAYWGAPVATADDANRAVSAAFAMQRALDRLNERWREIGRPTLSVGIGLHSGDAFVGNIGSPRRLEYTLIGDTVNVANRLVGRAEGGEILISEPVRRSLTLPVGLQARPEFTSPLAATPLGVWAVTPPRA